MPKIPATPAKIGGAGTGNLNAANTIPHPKPVSVESNISLTYFLFLIHLAKTFLNLYMQKIFVSYLHLKDCLLV